MPTEVPSSEGRVPSAALARYAAVGSEVRDFGDPPGPEGLWVAVCGSNANAARVAAALNDTAAASATYYRVMVETDVERIDGSHRLDAECLTEYGTQAEAEKSAARQAEHIGPVYDDSPVTRLFILRVAEHEVWSKAAAELWPAGVRDGS